LRRYDPQSIPKDSYEIFLKDSFPSEVDNPFRIRIFNTTVLILLATEECL